jgi:hypothetical protein
MHYLCQKGERALPGKLKNRGYILFLPRKYSVSTTSSSSFSLSSTRQRLVKTADWEEVARAVLTCKVCNSVKQLTLPVVTSYKSPVNPVITPSHVFSHERVTCPPYTP